MVAELFGIVVAAGIFMLAWNSRRFLDNNYLLFIGIGYLFIAGLHVAHTLLYKGMGPLSEYASPDHAAQLWIAARVVTSLTFLIAPLFLERRLYVPGIIASYLAVCGLIAGLLVTDTFPHCFVAPHGLTPFKKIAECVISVLFIASAGLLYAPSVVQPAGSAAADRVDCRQHRRGTGVHALQRRVRNPQLRRSLSHARRCVPALPGHHRDRPAAAVLTAVLEYEAERRVLA